MKIALLALAVSAVATGAVAAAPERATDMDYMRASRCKGLAAGLSSERLADLNAWLKAAGRARMPAVVDRAENERARAQRETRSSEAKGRLTAELEGPCMAFSLANKDMASR
jgi:hypothetical protein